MRISKIGAALTGVLLFVLSGSNAALADYTVMESTDWDIQVESVIKKDQEIEISEGGKIKVLDNVRHQQYVLCGKYSGTISGYFRVPSYWSNLSDWHEFLQRSLSKKCYDDDWSVAMGTDGREPLIASSEPGGRIPGASENKANKFSLHGYSKPGVGSKVSCASEFRLKIAWASYKGKVSIVGDQGLDAARLFEHRELGDAYVLQHRVVVDWADAGLSNSQITQLRAGSLLNAGVWGRLDAQYLMAVEFNNANVYGQVYDSAAMENIQAQLSHKTGVPLKEKAATSLRCF